MSYHIKADTKWPPFHRRHFQIHFLNENVIISARISLEFIPKGPINNIPVLVQIMAWCRPGDKPLSETMIVRLPTHICVTRSQWVNQLYLFASCIRPQWVPFPTIWNKFQEMHAYLYLFTFSIVLRLHACCRYLQMQVHLKVDWGGWGCEVSCGGHQWQRGKTTMGSALDGAVLDFTQILAYLVHSMSRSQLYLGFGHFGWLHSFFSVDDILTGIWLNCIPSVEITLLLLADILLQHRALFQCQGLV